MSTPTLPPATAQELESAAASLASERQREQALGLFARRMTHDMSNFVTVIRTYSELLLGDMPPEAVARADVQEIYRAADAIVDYLHRVSRFARSGNGRPGLVQVDEMLQDVVHHVESALPGYGVTLSHALDCRLSTHVDAASMADAIREVLVNACEASPRGGTAWLRSWAATLDAPIVDAGVPVTAGQWAVIEVADQGAGFAADVRGTAADPFVTTKAGVRGAGFGLTLARGVTWQAGGQLVCDDRDGRTCVRFWLPAAGTSA